MVDGVKGFAQVDKHCASQLTLVTLIHVPSNGVSKAHGGPLSGVAFAKTALVRTKNSVALKISVQLNVNSTLKTNNNNNSNNNNGITQAAFLQSGSSSTWGTNGFTSLSTDGVAKEDHLNIQPHGQAGNRTRDLLASSLRSYQLS